MITATYAMSGMLMAITGWLFAAGYLDAVQQTVAWTGIFFVASAAASSAYLTVGESFPLEVRAVAHCAVLRFRNRRRRRRRPAIFGALIDTGVASVDYVGLSVWRRADGRRCSRCQHGWLFPAERRALKEDMCTAFIIRLNLMAN